MGFEFIYSLGVLLSLLAADIVSLKRLEKKEHVQLAKYLKLQSSPLFIAGGILWAILAIFIIPKLFYFEWNIPGYFVGMAIYLVWIYKVRIPKWKVFNARVNQIKMEERGQKGARVAGLQVRRLEDYVSRYLLSIPYVVLLSTGLYIAFWFISHSFSERRVSEVIIFSQFLFGVGLTIYFRWQMLKLVKGPIDLRSSAPAVFAQKTHGFIKGRVRILLLSQISYLVSMLTLIFAFTIGFPGKFWFMAGQVPFVTSLLWLSISSVRGMAKLEEQRWQPADQEAAKGSN